ncbi:hypothetical protein J6590_058448 [Homalodisca vitripennis]|nr:hypothetical protein J6590_058448 [Homalodisca vitripennis]
MLHQYLMGLYDNAYFPKFTPTLPPRLAPQYRSYLACARVVCVVYCIVHYRQAETSPAELLMLKRLAGSHSTQAADNIGTTKAD